MKPTYIVKPDKWRKKKDGTKQPYQGTYYPAYPEKYAGTNLDDIKFRSGLELRFFKYLDEKSSVLAWSSEQIKIPYIKPTDGKFHRYIVDIIATMKHKDGNVKTFLIEIKPEDQTKPPVPPKKMTRKGQARFYNAKKTYAINEAKWTAARQVCKEKGWEFSIITEKQLGHYN